MSFNRPDRTYRTDLEAFVFEQPLADSHEHLCYESAWLEDPADVLQDLLANYVPADLKVAGATDEAIKRAQDPNDTDIEARLAGILPALERCRHTGYGESVFLSAKLVYGLETLTVSGLESAGTILESLKKPGERLRILKEVARIDHVQTDDFCWPCLPDPSGRDFFFYDLSWRGFCNGEVKPEAILKETGMDVRDVRTLEQAMEAIFEKYAPCAIGVKSQHAYNRTLEWIERDPADVEIALNKSLSHPDTPLPEGDRLCLGDWCWARGVELAQRHELPFKLHTGYYVGNNHMRVGRIPSGNLCPILLKYPQAQFVLMHIAYPYQDEAVAMVKHFPNTVVDLCWAWSIDPFSTRDFLRRALHAVPVNRVLGFGGDTRYPTSAFAYSEQARLWIHRTLSAEVQDGFLSEKEALAVAGKWMNGNQREYFRLEEKQRTVQDWTGSLLDK